jgi:superfamily I DNA/RNA helicase
MKIATNNPSGNNDQKFAEILASSSGKVCVIAGPGSGKTRGVLIPKTKELLSDRTIDADEILILSFSRLSALDLKKKVEVFESSPKAMTLHSLCLAFLISEDNHDIRERIESIILDFEKEALISDLKLKFPDIDKRQLKKMLNEFSAGWAIQPHDQVFIENDQKKAFKRTLLNWLDEHKAAMMEEIVYHAVDLAKKIETDFLNNYRYILVDEFQDLNKLEQEFVEILAANSDLLLVVGDPDQSIYGFKYAHPVGIQEFASGKDVEDHFLPYVGRCSKKILDIANQILLQSNPQRIELLKPIENQINGKAELRPFRFQDQEFDFVINSISQEVKKGIKPQDIIVLVPRKGMASDFVNYALSCQNDVNFSISSKSEFSLMEQGRIIELSIISNPTSALHIRAYLGLQDQNHFAEEIDELKKNYNCGLLELLNTANPGDFPARKKKIRSVCSEIEKLKELIAKYENNDDTKNLVDDLFPDGSEDLEAVRKILLSLFEDGDSIKDLYSKFVDYARNVDSPEDSVRVMTLIGSKGLDADSVYIIGCNDGNIPGDNKSEYLSDSEYKAEQRRLLYVGVTRAKKKLVITWSRYIPFAQSRNQSTSSTSTKRFNGQCYSQVGLSEFLQDLNFEED